MTHSLVQHMIIEKLWYTKLLGSGEMHFLPHGSYLSVGETDTNYYDQLWNHKIDTCSWEVKSSRNKEDSVGLVEEETDTKMCKELTSERRKELSGQSIFVQKRIMVEEETELLADKHVGAATHAGSGHRSVKIVVSTLKQW